MPSLQKTCFFVLLLVAPLLVTGQETWPSPEVAQMYAHAGEYMDKGNYKDAIVTYKQAMVLAPGKMVLYRQLGKAYYLSGNYAEAEQTLSVVLGSASYMADTACYCLQAAAMAAMRKFRQARSVLKTGLEKFPGSGVLYHELGEVNSRAHDMVPALNAWLDGIEKAPLFTANYLAAARTYLASDNVLWGLLYGELYLNMEPDTAGTQELKNELFAGYKKMFDNLVNDEPLKQGNALKQATVKGFEDAVRNTYLTLTPVVSDGVSTENLVMVRTRFLMNWFAAYDKKYPFSLFTYMDELVRTGHFEIYNEWLFGKAENAAQFKAWDLFHEGDIDRFNKWRVEHPLIISGSDIHNSRDMKGMFGKRKK